MPGFEQILCLDATAQAEMVRQGEISARELIEASITQIERLDDSLNAVVTREYERALEAAAIPSRTAPFAGVPLLLKDVLSSWAGVRMTWGSRLAHNVSSAANSELVNRLERAGLVILGKTNTSELGLLPTCEPARFGATRNPWSLDHSCGGSSGGSAAAVAAAMVPMAMGSDGGGSIRIPAACCGLFGLKPTRARNPMGPDVGEVLGGMVVEHAITRSVRDSALLLDLTAGPDPGAPYFVAAPERAFADQCRLPPEPLSIAFTSKAPAGASIHPECEQAVHDAVLLCESLGHRVTEAVPEYDHQQAVEIFSALWAAGCASVVGFIAERSGRPPQPGLLEPLTEALYLRGSQMSATDYLRCLQGMHRVARKIAELFQDYDLFLSSTLATLPPPLGYLDPIPGDPLEVLRRAGEMIPVTPLANMTGQPAMSVPLHWSAGGLPVGVHFMGRYGDEATMFRLAAQLEQACPWSHRWPEIARGSTDSGR